VSAEIMVRAPENTSLVTLAEAGAFRRNRASVPEVPAFAGMTTMGKAT